MWTIHFVLFLACLNLIKCEPVCNHFETCGQCIGNGESERCVWCEQEAVEGARCQPESYLKSNKEWCNEAFIQNPKSVRTEKIDKDFGDKINNVSIIQFRPQEMRFKARPGESIHFNMSYKPAQDFPLDVYYLMDNSDTMKKHKDTLVTEAHEIYKQLTTLTNNVQLGVGTFVEKPVYPYFDENNPTQKGHAFLNVLSLTNKMTEFQDKINNIPFGANFDDMEAGLDALMQVMACEEEIGWRPGSRRIIVFCTDSPYHSAGDGKMLGIIKPNDMKCHLKNQIYELERDQDYPSVSQISEVASSGKFSIIFAAINAVRNVYTSLAKEIMGANYAELKTESNIVDIITKAYLKSVQTIPLNPEIPSFVQLILEQNCEAKPQRNCASNHSNPVVNIPATLKVLNCPVDNKNVELSISPITLKDKLTIKLDIICDCECKTKSNVLSPACNNAGYIQCGICKCLDTSYGDNCECNIISTGSDKKEEDFKKCLKYSNDSEPCSGRGDCICGKCKCKKGFSGKHCEYDDSSCDRTGGILCAGHGNCTLNSCHCDNDWTGPGCACPTSNKVCIAPYSREVCSGNGDCICGTCNCKQIEGKDERYTGVFCDTCDECQAKYCKAVENYAECYYRNSTEYCKTTFKETENMHVEIVNKTEINSLKWVGAAWCKKVLEDGSILIFRYYHDTTTHELHLIIQKELEAPPIDNKWIAVGVSIAVVVLIGLLTLIIWKILVDLHDKREYAKFEEESRAQGFNVQNPLYEEPAVNFSNPIYNRNAR